MRKEYWFVVFTALLFGLITVGAQFFKDLGMSLFEISFFKPFLMCVMLLPVILVKREYFLGKKMLFFFTIYGLFGALLVLAQFAGIISGIPVAVVALLLYTQPVWTVLFGRFAFNEHITFKKLFSIFVAILGVIVILEPWSAGQVSIKGIVSALCGGMLLSLWLVFGKKSGIARQHYITSTFGWAFFSAVWLLILLPVVSFFVKEPGIVRLSFDFPLANWFYLVVWAFFAGILPFALFYQGIRKISASTSGIILLLEPVSATLLAAVLFSQPIGFNILVGGFLILFANYVAIKDS